ncbi:hypothetical protein Ahu01nite_052270 [Winogradskya humida]|uniref:Uncharacterized protein n=1 Tax=Winogradskya humida TaxID=113566 RepID=A0ABQ3ZU56_9ACTN|nr:hypothetical protein Ahu01nite_052270 [Actinoplanes humidus]
MTTTALTNPFLEALGQRTGIRVEFYDPTGDRYGFPTFPYHQVPEGLATRRQLRAQSLCPGGYDPVAQILWRHYGQIRVAYLYRRDLATPKRVATPAQLTAISKALRARRTCPLCHQLKAYYIPRRTGACLACEPIGLSAPADDKGFGYSRDTTEPTSATVPDGVVLIPLTGRVRQEATR